MNYKRSAQKALQVRQKIKAADEFFLNECLSDVNGYSSGLMDSRAKKERNIPKYLKGSLGCFVLFIKYLKDLNKNSKKFL